ncbi:MAG: glycosyltransferase family 2 protein [Patescibacteria group bacterium]
MSKFAIILINYKGYARKFLSDCLQSLNKQTVPRNEYEIIVVDNAADEESREYLKTFSDIKIIERPDGNYCAGNNAGIKYALQNGAQYVVILNMDVEVKPEWLAELKIGLKKNPQCGILQSKILLFPKNEQEKKHPLLNTIGNKINFLGFGFTDNYRVPESKVVFAEDYPLISGYASGCSFITTKEVLQKIGDYDEELYMYHDDLDLSARARLAGYEIRLAPKSVLFHKYEFSRSNQMIFHMEKNRALTFLTMYSLPTMMILFPIFLLFELAMLFYSFVNGWFEKKKEIYKYFFKKSTWRHVFAKRRIIKKLKTIKEKEFIRDIKGGIYFQEIDNPLLKYLGNPFFEMYWYLIKFLIIW